MISLIHLLLCLCLWHGGVFPSGSLRPFVSVAFAGLEVWSVLGWKASGVTSRKGPGFFFFFFLGLGWFFFLMGGGVLAGL